MYRQVNLVPSSSKNKTMLFLVCSHRQNAHTCQKKMFVPSKFLPVTHHYTTNVKQQVEVQVTEHLRVRFWPRCDLCLELEVGKQRAVGDGWLQHTPCHQNALLLSLIPWLLDSNFHSKDDAYSNNCTCFDMHFYICSRCCITLLTTSWLKLSAVTDWKHHYHSRLTRPLLNLFCSFASLLKLNTSQGMTTWKTWQSYAPSTSNRAPAPSVTGVILGPE